MKNLKKEENGLSFLFKDSYLKTIQNSVGSKLFRNLYFSSGNKKIDVLHDGNLSCAVFVSWILRNFYLIKDMHTTVSGLVKDLGKSGWQKTKNLKNGAILVWEEKKFKNGAHKHIGFYTGKNSAISNRSEKGLPIKHHWTFGSKSDKNYRRVIEIWWSKKLE